MPPSYSICVTTYVKRFSSYFIPLIKDLTAHFPGIEIICIANGHPDTALQHRYLKEYAAFLSQYPNVRHYSFESHQSLAKLWNLLVIYSTRPNCLILNDDLRVGAGFRKPFEEFLAHGHDFFMVNNQFSHFCISKKAIEKAGWFDERFLGIGNEDGDTLIRLTRAGIPILSLSASDIYNFTAPADDPTWAAISANTDGKYTLANKEFFQKKWDSTWFNPGLKEWDVEFKWKDELVRAKLREGMDAPLFYDYSLLTTGAPVEVQQVKTSGNSVASNARLLPLLLKQKIKRLFFGR